MSKKTIALIISLVILTAALLAVALTTEQPLTPKSEQTTTTQENQPTPTPPAQTILMLSPNPLSAKVGSNEIVVEIDSGTNAVTTVQLELAYDPRLISNVQITPETFLTNASVLLNKNDTSTGRYSYALGLLPSQIAKAGKGAVAKITFTPRNATLTTKDTELTLLPKSLVTASGISPSVLKETKSTKIILPTGGITPQQPVVSITPPQITP